MEMVMQAESTSDRDCPGKLSTQELSIGVASTMWEMAGYYQVRNQVFVVEQGIYSLTDRDQYDEQAIPLVAVMNGVVAGAVRCYRMRDKLWYGGRLAVLPEYRVYNIGAALVRQAVETMRCHAEVERFLATVQIQNVRFFKRLGWTVLGRTLLLKGVKHKLMESPLVGNGT